MNKYSIIAIIVAVLLGAALNSLFFNITRTKAQTDLLKQYENTYKTKEDSAKKLIVNLHSKLTSYDKKVKSDSVTITKLLRKIQQDKIRTEQTKNQVIKLTPNELKDWITDRYN